MCTIAAAGLALSAGTQAYSSYNSYKGMKSQISSQKDMAKAQAAVDNAPDSSAIRDDERRKRLAAGNTILTPSQLAPATTGKKTLLGA